MIYFVNWYILLFTQRMQGQPFRRIIRRQKSARGLMEDLLGTMAVKSLLCVGRWTGISTYKHMALLCLSLTDSGEWTIDRVLVSVAIIGPGPTATNTCKEKGPKGQGCVRWSRNLSADVHIAPFSTGTVSIPVIDAENVKDNGWSWNVVGVNFVKP